MCPDRIHNRFQFRNRFCRALTCFKSFLCLLNFFCTSNISRIFTGKSKLSQSKWIGTERRSFSGRNQFICRSNRIMNLRHHFKHQILCQCRHLRPVFNIRAKLDFYAWICNTLAVKDSILINSFIKEVFLMSVISGKFFRGCQETFVCCCCCDRSCIHKCNRRNLSILDLGAFTIREVSGGMTDAERIVCRCISCTKTWSAECSLNNRTCFKKICQDSISCKFHIDRSTCRINTECKCISSNACTTKDICCCADIFKSTARASCNDSLIHIKLSVDHFVFQCIRYFTIQADLRFFLNIIQNIIKICFQFINGICVARMEWHGDHRFDLT